MPVPFVVLLGTMPVEPAITALEHVVAHGVHRQVKGKRLVATDLDWVPGEGPLRFAPRW
ncbi:hypothetical protein GCM10009789_87440 [Kribbella sancticallisti]|uniref:Uncharacterized protein n=1 Tax=Kribbella sancticallisti TaxID=460087 RepID=A0ABN2EWK1_9ACTN